MSVPPPSQPSGWYPDPLVPGTQRYWDGQNWTEHTAPLVSSPASTLGPNGLPYASFWRRFFGSVIDAFVLAVPIVVLAFVLFVPVFMRASSNPDSASLDALPVWGPLAFLAAVMAIQGLYMVIGIHVFGRTVGGAAVGIRCVDVNGARPSWGSALIRYGVVAGFGLLAQLPLIGIVAFPLQLVTT